MPYQPPHTPKEVALRAASGRADVATSSHALEVVPKQIMVVPMDTLPWLSEYYWKRMCKFMLLPPPCDQVPAQVHWHDANLRWLRANPRFRNFTQDDVS